MSAEGFAMGKQGVDGQSLFAAGKYHRPRTWLMVVVGVAANFKTNLTNSVNGLIWVKF